MDPFIRIKIQRHARKEYGEALENLGLAQAEEWRIALIEAGRAHNTGATLAAMIALKVKHVREQLLALAEAYAVTFEFFGLPCDEAAERSLESSATQIAAGAESAMRGQMELIAARMGRKVNPASRSAYLPQDQIKSAIRAARLRLNRQRIPFNALDGDTLTTKPPQTQNSLPALAKAAKPLDKAGRVLERKAFMAPYLERDSLGAIATDAGIATSSLYRWEKGDLKFRPNTRAKLANFLGVDPREIPN